MEMCQNISRKLVKIEIAHYLFIFQGITSFSIHITITMYMYTIGKSILQKLTKHFRKIGLKINFRLGYSRKYGMSEKQL